MPGKSILPLALSPHQKLVKTSSEWVGTAIRRLNPQSEVTRDFLTAHDIVLPVPVPLEVGKKAKKTLSNADPESENKAAKKKPSGLFQNIINKLKADKDANPAPPSSLEELQEDAQGRKALELIVTEESAERLILPAEPINSDVQILRMQLTFILENLPAYAWFGSHPFDPTEWAGIFENLQRVAYKRLNVLLAQSQPLDPDETHQRILYNGLGRGKKGWRSIRALSRSEFDKTVLLGCTVADPCSPAPNELLQSELKSLLVLLHCQQMRYISVKNPVPILRFGATVISFTKTRIRVHEAYIRFPTDLDKKNIAPIHVAKTLDLGVRDILGPGDSKKERWVAILAYLCMPWVHHAGNMQQAQDSPLEESHQGIAVRDFADTAE